MLVFVTDPVRAAAILLPILIAQDVVGVWAFRRTVDWPLLGWMLPGAAAGVALGYGFAASVTPVAVMAAVGATSVAFGAYRLWAARHAVPRAAARLPEWVGSLYGAASGFTSQIAHAGQPPFQLWVLPRGLAPQLLVGTTAVYFRRGQLDQGARLSRARPVHAGQPAHHPRRCCRRAIVSTLAGVWLVRRVDPDRFLYTAIYWLMILVGVALIGEALF